MWVKILLQSNSRYRNCFLFQPKLNGVYVCIYVKDDLWPELALLLLHVNAVERREMAQRIGPVPPREDGRSSKPKPRHALSRSELFVVGHNPQPAPTTNHSTTSMPSPFRPLEEQGNDASDQRVARSAYQKHVLAVVHFVNQLLRLPCCHKYLKPYCGVCAMLLVPLMGSHQVHLCGHSVDTPKRL